MRGPKTATVFFTRPPAQKGRGPVRSAPRVLSVAAFAAAALFFDGRPALAIDPTRALTQYAHRAWGTDEGLPQGSVSAIAQTPDGYLWLGTQEGLVRFDGMKFTVFDTSNTPGLKSDYVTALYASPGGDLWIGTQGGGLSQHRDGRFSALTTAQGLASDRVKCLWRDRAGALWIGTDGGGLSRLQDGQFTNLSMRDGLPGNSVWALLEDRDGSLWIGTLGGGLAVLKDGHLRTLTVKDGLASNSILSLHEDRGGGLWVGTSGGGVDLLKGARVEHHAPKDGLSGKMIGSLLQDRDGNVWAGALDGGLSRFSNGRFEALAGEAGVSNETVLSLFEDRDGSVWAGTAVGLNQFLDGKFTVYTSREGLPGDEIVSVYEDHEGSLWIGTTKGLARLRNGSVRRYTTDDGLASNRVQTIGEDRDGALWIGTMGGGLSRLKDGKFTTLTAKDGLSCNVITCIREDRQGSLWLGTSNGLTRLRRGEITNYTTQDGLTANIVVAIAEGRDGSLWVGTNGGGLDRLKDGRFTAYGAKDGMAADTVAALYEDSDGVLWIGTLGKGVYRFRDGKFSACTRREGLFSDSVFQILEDRQGRLWMTSNRGIFHVKRKDLNDLADGKTATVASTSYGTTDGLKTAECVGGSQPAGWTTRDGRLWFPTVKGLASIDPARIRTSEIPPPVVVEQVSVDGGSLSPGASIASGFRRLAFRYGAMDFLSPSKVKFRYRLAGFERAWVDAGPSREATYTGLRPGSYSFEVVAANGDGVWNSEGAKRSIVVTPRFYETMPFYGFCVLAVLGVAAGAHRLRLQGLEAKNAVLTERNRIARDIHDTVAQGLTGIVLQLETADTLFPSQTDAVRGCLVRAREQVRDSLEETRRAITALRPRPLEQARLPDALRMLGESMTLGTAMKLSVKVHGRPRDLPSDVEDDLWRIAQEALTNAVRHSRGHRIQLIFQYDKRRLELIVADDGEGLTRMPGAEGAGFGLKGIQERVQKRRWRLSVDSRPGQGTQISVEVPLRPAFPWGWA